MHHTCHRLAYLFAILVQLASAASAENWPGWRGPRSDGTSLETGLPTKWSGSENIAWKTPIPGLGHSSPIIWDDRIFLITAVDETKDRLLLCLDRKSGEFLWRQTVINAPLEKKQDENSYASSTPVTDGRFVYVTFLDVREVVVAAYDFAGRQQWIVRPGSFDPLWGFCHSPILYEDKILIACCGRTSGFVAALDRGSGRTVWKVEPKHHAQAFSNPFVATMDGRPQMIACANSKVTSYDPASGSELWSVDGPSKEYVATPVYSAQAGLLVIDSSWPDRFLVAIKPDGAGDVTAGKVAWKTKQGASYVSSPIAVGNYVMSVSFGSRKCFCCYDAATGKVLWNEGAAGRHHASPVSAGGLVYFLNDAGQTNIVRAAAKYELVATNELGEETYASPAISRGQIFLRGFKSLYCIGKGK